MRTTLEALTDPTRRRILEELSGSSRPAGELAGLFEISRPAVSRHLRVLREARLVTATRDAQRLVYSLSPAPLVEVDEWLHRVRGFWSGRLDALDAELTSRHEEPR